MHREFSKLILYSDLGENSILESLTDIFRDWQEKREAPDSLTRRIFVQVKRILDLATEYGFDENLWHNYLTFLLMMNENSFSLSCERIGAQEGTVNLIAKQDFQIFWNLFHYDFSKIETDLGIQCFSILSQYQAIPKKERRYNRTVSEKVQALSRALGVAQNGDEIFHLMTKHYRDVGVGMFGMNRAFRVQGNDHSLNIFPVDNTDRILLSDLVGYELQKKQLQYNTEAFLEGRCANNMLLYGDSGTGKSSSVKSLINEYYDCGLRMIELYKHQFKTLSQVIAQIKNRNFRFIIFIDDLSFEENEVEYKFLKAVIEGGVETKPDNVLICATSNRRHLIRETWNDRTDMEYKGDIHHSDTMEEKLSLSSRFGVQINYSVPNREQFLQMVSELAKRHGLLIPENILFVEANKWELRHGGVSGRTAQQFVNYLLGEK
ncbi:MAG: putative ATPase superfamily [Evtepia sp.]|jgi:predicted AAA+ superfamily ATPase|nr:putative ATPase superfamily [Evtepia sp.]